MDLNSQKVILYAPLSTLYYEPLLKCDNVEITIIEQYRFLGIIIDQTHFRL